MRIPRIFVPQPLTPGACVTLPEAPARHLVRVLRLKAGAPLVVFNGEGGEYAATLEAADARSARVRVSEFVDRTAESPLQITLAQGISRRERMDYTLQKAVELGVADIVPLLTERCQVRLTSERSERRCRHWHGVIAGAAEQSARTCLPELAPPVALSDWLTNSPSSHSLGLVLHPGAPQGLSALGDGHRRVTLLAGPEGGLSEGELASAQQAGFQAIRLGPRVLRTETAGVAALAAVQVLWGDMG